jgi:hypothetical protein
MSFQKTVLIIALIVLSVMLFFIALAMRGLKKSQGYPPEIAECPDYWTKNPDGTCKRPDNLDSPNFGTAKDNNIDCSQFPPGTEGTGEEAKKTFSADCTLEWDGITNIN